MTTEVSDWLIILRTLALRLLHILARTSGFPRSVIGCWRNWPQIIMMIQAEAPFYKAATNPQPMPVSDAEWGCWLRTLIKSYIAETWSLWVLSKDAVLLLFLSACYFSTFCNPVTSHPLLPRPVHSEPVPWIYPQLIFTFEVRALRVFEVRALRSFEVRAE